MIAAIDTDPKFLCALHDRRMIIVCFGACGIFHRYQSDKYQRPEDSHLQLFHGTSPSLLAFVFSANQREWFCEPVHNPPNFKLSVNLKAAKAMNHTIPTALLLRADKLIE